MPAKAPLFTPVVIGGCIISMIGFPVRNSFGEFRIPVARDFERLRAGRAPFRDMPAAGHLCRASL